MPVNAPKPNPRAFAIRFDLGDGKFVTLPPVSADQAMECLRLDPAEGEVETYAAYVERLNAQGKIVFGPKHEHLLKELAPFQVAEMISAMLFGGAGMDQAMFTLWRMSQPQNVARLSVLESLGHLESMTIELAAQLSKTPAEVGAMPLADAVALQEAIHKARQQEIDFQAAIHGAKQQ